MDFNELIMNFASRHGIEGLSIDDGAAAIEVDGIPVALADVAGDLLATAVVGEPPVEGRADFADMLLEANLESNAVFGKSRESGRYILSRRLPLAGLDGAALDAAIESLINSAELWRRLLEDYRPAAKAMAEAAANDESAFSSSHDGFLQV